MTIPELNSFVSQARADGQSDEQIRQTLTQQGWQEADVSSALNSSGSQATTPIEAEGRISAFKIPTIIIALAIIGGAGYYFYNQPTNTDPQTNQPYTTGSSGCLGWWRDGGPIYTNFIEGGSLPLEFPSDLPLPPSFSVVGRFPDNGKVSTIPESYTLSDRPVFCTDDTAEEIVNFYLNAPSPWEIYENFKVSGKADYSSGIAVLTAKKEQASREKAYQNIGIQIFPSNGKTIIFMSYDEIVRSR